MVSWNIHVCFHHIIFFLQLLWKEGCHTIGQYQSTPEHTKEGTTLNHTWIIQCTGKFTLHLDHNFVAILTCFFLPFFQCSQRGGKTSLLKGGCISWWKFCNHSDPVVIFLLVFWSTWGSIVVDVTTDDPAVHMTFALQEVHFRMFTSPVFIKRKIKYKYWIKNKKEKKKRTLYSMCQKYQCRSTLKMVCAKFC